MNLIDKYSKDKMKPKIIYKEGDTYSQYYNPFLPPKRISRKQKIWVRKTSKVLHIKIKHWLSLGQRIVFDEMEKQLYIDMYNKKIRLSSK